MFAAIVYLPSALNFFLSLIWFLYSTVVMENDLIISKLAMKCMIRISYSLCKEKSKLSYWTLKKTFIFFLFWFLNFYYIYTSFYLLIHAYFLYHYEMIFDKKSPFIEIDIIFVLCTSVGRKTAGN